MFSAQCDVSGGTHYLEIWPAITRNSIITSVQIPVIPSIILRIMRIG